jgi:signal transduction histidine kinase
MPLTKAVFGRVTLLLLAIGVLLVLALGGGLAWLMVEMQGFTQRVASAQEARATAGETLTLLQDAETGQRGFLLTGDEAYLEPYRNALERLPRTLSLLESRIVLDGGIPGPPREVRDLATRMLDEVRETVELARAGEREAALAAVRTGRGKAVMDEIRTLLAGIETRTTHRLARRTESLERVERGLAYGGAAALGLIGLLALGSVALAFRYTRELEAAQGALEDVNAELERRVAERTAELAAANEGLATANEGLAAANENLAAANEEVQRFAYIVSHDLRAPLVNVMGFTSELQAALEPLREVLKAADAGAPDLVTPAMREVLEEEIPEALGFIRSSTERMDRLINAILRLSREGRRALAPERLDMEAVIGGLAASLRHQLDAAGAEIRIEGSLPELVVDRMAVEQIFGNLLDNAVKYLDPARPGRIILRGHGAGRLAVFEVEDNGRGIHPRDHARVFELFRRAGAQDRPGEGIGLAHVRALARRLGGNVELESVPGHGSRFRVTLPRVPPAMPPARTPAQPQEASTA